MRRGRYKRHSNFVYAPKYKQQHEANVEAFHYGSFLEQWIFGEMTKNLVIAISEGKQECIICQNPISTKAKIWNCQQCYQPFHIRCIKKWISKINEESNTIFHWACPKCNYKYAEAQPEYTCYCGKSKYPGQISLRVPHSCGNLCNKSRHQWCSHNKCIAPCHPGPCLPCYVGSTAVCFCGKVSKTVECNANVPFSCSLICGKKLNCKMHFCEKACHAGECAPCSRMIDTKCYCGKESKQMECGIKWTCNGVCNKLLSCSVHNCRNTCHPGECSKCSFNPENIKTCPCGMTKLSEKRTKCTDPIPCCEYKCNKLLPCKKHRCGLKCHSGDCQKCVETIDQFCKCGKSSRKIECYKANYPYSEIKKLNEERLLDFVCDKVCKIKMSCGKHLCSRVCCEVNLLKVDPYKYHLCTQTCGKPLKCGEHTCLSFCHLGDCKKCNIISGQPLYCACKTMKIDPPIPCGTPYPNCRKICSKPLPCGHICESFCHHGSCPPCIVNINKYCACGKVIIYNTQCSRECHCSTPCNKILACGHKCVDICHKQCKQVDNSIGCGQKCNKPHEFCGHKCQKVCHPGVSCENSYCPALIRYVCKCGRSSKLEVCMNTNKEVVHTIECTEECARYERNKAIALALGNYKEELDEMHPDYYPETMVDFALKNLDLLKKIEILMDDIIKTKNDEGTALPDMHTHKLFNITNLIENNYKLKVYILQGRVEVFYSKEGRIPKSKLSDYCKRDISLQIINNFEASIFCSMPKGYNVDDLKTNMYQFKNMYYAEENPDHRTYSLRFYSLAEAEKATEFLKNNTPFSNVEIISHSNKKVEKKKETKKKEEKLTDDGFTIA